MQDISLQATARSRNARVVVTIAGDLDVYTAPQLRSELGKGLSNLGDVAVVLDLRDVGFLDSAGLAALLWAKSARRESRHELTVLVAPGSQPERVFKLAGLDGMVSDRE